MSRRRFYAPPENFNQQRVALSPDESKHLRDVLRLKAGDEIFVFDGEGREFSCEITEAGRGSEPAILRANHKVEPARAESPLSLTLAIALLKGEKFDLVVQKATELGVSRIVPVMTVRANVKLKTADDIAKRVSRWRRLALEAAKQSGRAFVPVVELPQPFSFVIERETNAEETRLFFSERDGARLSAALKNQTPLFLTAFVGPEGGWDDEELSLAQKADWQIITLGGRVLRAETAGIVVAALLQHLFGDLT
jgi:16S rRNA (uracil1498-N3)-methyltransferase